MHATAPPRPPTLPPHPAAITGHRRWQVRLVKCAGEAYAAMRFRDALKYSFYGVMDARDRYRTGTGPTVGARASLLRQWSEWFALLMAPIAPHWSEEVWSILGNSGCAVRASWPVPTAAEDSALTAAGEYLFHVAHALNTAFASRGKKKPAKGAPPAATEKPNQVRRPRGAGTLTVVLL